MGCIGKMYRGKKTKNSRNTRKLWKITKIVVANASKRFLIRKSMDLNVDESCPSVSRNNRPKQIGYADAWQLFPFLWIYLLWQSILKLRQSPSPKSRATP